MSLTNTLLQEALDTRDTHGGCISNGGFVLLALANIASLELSNSSRVKSYDSLISLVQQCIGAGCEPLLSPAPAHKSQSESVAAPAEVGQGQGTITVQELQRWLDKKAAAARQAIKEGCDFSDRKCVHEPAIDYCRIASALIREFIQEQGESQSESVAAPAEVGQGTTLPVDVPESETLWAYLSKGYGLDYVRSGLVCGIPHDEQEARNLRDRVHRAWAKIVSEVQ